MLIGYTSPKAAPTTCELHAWCARGLNHSGVCSEIDSKCKKIGCGLPKEHVVHNKPEIGPYPPFSYHSFVQGASPTPEPALECGAPVQLAGLPGLPGVLPCRRSNGHAGTCDPFAQFAHTSVTECKHDYGFYCANCVKSGNPPTPQIVEQAWLEGRDAAAQCAESADNTAGRITISRAIRALSYHQKK
jgi:hypothetical protein